VERTDGLSPEALQRLGQLVKGMGGADAAAKRTDIPKSTIDKYLGGHSEPPASRLAKITAAAGSSVDYVIFGKTGAPIVERSDPATNVVRLEPRELQGRSANDDLITIPRLNIEASAGLGRAVIESDEEESRIPFRRSWLRDMGVSPQYAEFITGRGDSMKPTIEDGDLLLVNRAIDRIESEGIYAFVMHGLVSVKRLQLVFSGSIRIISDNREHYPPETVPASEMPAMHVVGRVVWIGRRLR
jgi:phage repressor protein C with HTH and peptisase S24 domain